MKVLHTAAIIVGAVALIATGYGAIFGAAAFASLAAGVGLAGLTLTTVAAIGTIAGIVGSLTASKPKLRSGAGTVGGSLTDFKLDPNAGIPMMFGRTFNGGNIVHRDTWGTDNQYQGFIVVYSGCGPIDAIEGFYVDRAVIAFAGGAASGGTYGSGDGAPWMWLQTQLGLTPEAAALASAVAGMPGWTAAHKLSGLCAASWVIKFDKAGGKKFAGGVPRSGIVGTGVRAWDPRLDSTFPGGSGPQRLADPTTWAFTANPYILGHQFGLGWFEGPDSILVGGVGVPLESMDTDAWLEAANIADANGWTVSGVRYSLDPKWDTLKLLCEAGMGEPLWLGARLSCLVSAPKVSIATITSKDLRGNVKTVGTQTRRGGRINTIIPDYRSEDHGWEMIPAHAVSASTYVAEDGGVRTRERPYAMIADLDQVAVAAAYSIVNGREFGPISIPLDPRWMGLRPGMCVTLEIPEASLVGQKAIVLARTITRDSVNFDMRSETPAKHPFALGTTTTAPPTPSLAPPDYEQAALDFETAAQAKALIRGSSARFDPTDASPFSGADAGGTTTVTVHAHYRDYPDRSLLIEEMVLAGLPLWAADHPGVYLFYDDQTRQDTTPVLEWTFVSADAVNSDDHPYRHYVGAVALPAAGAPDTGGAEPPYSGGGGYCVTEDAMIAVSENGAIKRAGDLVAGERVWTMHEHSGEWGMFLVTATEIEASADVWMFGGLKATGDHRLFAGAGRWVRMREVPGAMKVSPASVVKITVEDAHTYVANGLLSHNRKDVDFSSL